MRRRRGMSWQEFCARAAELPGVEQGRCYGTPALYVRKKFLCRLKEDGDSVAIKAWRRAASRKLLLARAG